MKLGSEEHKTLFCRNFIESHLTYEPEQLSWPQLDDITLSRLRAIPFWRQALDTERRAGAMVAAFVETVDDPLIRQAIALQGQEESRHARLIQTLVKQYHIDLPTPSPIALPLHISADFAAFGFGECLDSFFAFGLFSLAGQADFFPDSLFTLFDPILSEEARHIVFFVNWFTYEQINHGWGLPPLRAARTLWHYSRAIRKLIAAFGGADTGGARFAATDAGLFAKNLTAEKFLTLCLKENQRRMRQFDPNLLQPKLLPQLAAVSLRILQLMPRRRPRQTIEGVS
ncbi:MAG: ferritin-like domain-containing protein [Pseudanabaenales cyanobacterium]|nr:ferritin-like domain-containing protein [Pseudanabaenales cyanobacterium]